MKFVLVLQICSAISQQCTEPVQIGRYKDHFDCATAGFINAMGAIREIGSEEVNKNKLLVNFSCKEQENVYTCQDLQKPHNVIYKIL